MAKSDNHDITISDESHLPGMLNVEGPRGELELLRLDGFNLVTVECDCGLEEVVVAITDSDTNRGVFIPLNRYRALQVAGWLLQLAEEMTGPQHGV